MAYDQREAERKRMYALVDKAIANVYDDDEDPAPSSLRLDTFAIVAIYVWEDGDGDEQEGVGVHSETKRPTLTRGILERGLDRIRDAADKSGTY